MTEHDPVNSPSHYTSHPSGVECKDIIKHHNWAVGSAIKYLWRQGLKSGDNPVIQELRKAIKCIQIEIERIEELQPKPEPKPEPGSAFGPDFLAAVRKSVREQDPYRLYYTGRG